MAQVWYRRIDYAVYICMYCTIARVFVLEHSGEPVTADELVSKLERFLLSSRGRQQQQQQREQQQWVMGNSMLWNAASVYC